MRGRSLKMLFQTQGVNSYVLEKVLMNRGHIPDKCEPCQASFSSLFFADSNLLAASPTTVNKSNKTEKKKPVWLFWTTFTEMELNGMMLLAIMKNQLFVKTLKDTWTLPDKLSPTSEYLKKYQN